jgi:hypothetical protein
MRQLQAIPFQTMMALKARHRRVTRTWSARCRRRPSQPATRLIEKWPFRPTTTAAAMNADHTKR